ncbi:MAG: SMC family ATPase [Chloroflexi bacterium]|nr:SMC family ATPase [Chloroflexota bacterium]
MIPLRLRLRNFLGYRDSQELSLDGIHLACLSGENGVGKSALLDAMTWAIWGRARGRDRGRTDADSLIHTGQSEMEVELEFGVGRGMPEGEAAKRYRALRKHKRVGPGRPSQSILELQVAGGAEPSRTWQPIASGKDAQHKIGQLLRLDYETFINSSFLLQGRADEFTVKKSNERKQLLGEILGLSLYDELADRAKEKRRQEESQVRLLDSEMDNIVRELSLKSAHETELQLAREKLSRLEPQLRSQEAALALLRQKQGELEAKAAELKGMAAELSRAQADAQVMESRQREHERNIKGYEALIGRREEIEASYSQLQLAREEWEVWNQKVVEVRVLEQQQHRLENAIKDARVHLEKESSLLKLRVTELQTKAQLLPKVQQSIAQGQAWFAESNGREEAIKQKKQAIQETRDAINTLQAASTQTASDIASLKEKTALLANADAHCPLCEAELGEGGKQILQAKYAAESQSKAEARDNCLRSLAKYQKEVPALQREADDAETKLSREREAAHKRMAVLESQLEQAGAAQAVLAAEEKKLADLERLLTRSEFAHQEQADLAGIRGSIAALGYDYVKHQEMGKRLKMLESAETQKRQLDDAEIRIQSDRLALSQVLESIARSRAKRQELEDKKQVLTGDLAYVPELARKLREAEDSYRISVSEERSYRDQMARAEGSLERLSALEQSMVEKEALRASAAREEAVYRDLAEAFGKRGVPALLIEAALPELEAEANHLLSRMTENRLSIKLETQRELKSGKGDPVETLDIKISDELGTRDYELFSGGEAFRVNFALRIALSKLLARRAGAPLPTLVIDEGFGTQDSTGREKLVEAINSIQEDFEKILVITHIEELKDLFPVRIEVTKTSEGSTFRVVE